MAKGQKYNPKWHDTPEARTRRTNERRARIKAVILAAGWKNESEMLTAMGKGEIEVPRKPAEQPPE